MRFWSIRPGTFGPVHTVVMATMWIAACTACLLSLALLALPIVASNAAPPHDLRPVKSRFTILDLTRCDLTHSHPDGNAWRCEGIKGFPVHIAEGDARFFLSFGDEAETRRAATQTLAPFNTVFPDGKSRLTIEWRYRRRDGPDRPYAVIVRYFTADGEGRKGEVLVVTRLTAKEACHLAYVDALSNAEPVALARSAADELAADFDCSGEPRVVGVRGKSPM
jgi:hypothetical protein